MVFCVHTFPKFFPYIHLYIVIKKGFALKKKKTQSYSISSIYIYRDGFYKGTFGSINYLSSEWIKLLFIIWFQDYFGIEKKNIEFANINPNAERSVIFSACCIIVYLLLILAPRGFFSITSHKFCLLFGLSWLTY
jgi:hypothetical protein